MIQRRAPLARSQKRLVRSQPLWKGRVPRAKTGGQQPEALDTWRKQAKRGHEKWRRVIYCKEPSGICPMCHARRWTDAAHIFPKGPYAHVRLDPDNGVPLCRTCHGHFDTDHELKVAFALRYLGAEKYEALRLRSIGRGKTDMRLALMLLDAELVRLRPVLDGMGRGPR